MEVGYFLLNYSQRIFCGTGPHRDYTLTMCVCLRCPQIVAVYFLFHNLQSIFSRTGQPRDSILNMSVSLMSLQTGIGYYFAYAPRGISPEQVTPNLLLDYCVFLLSLSMVLLTSLLLPGFLKKRST